MGITYLQAGVDQRGKDAAVDDILSMMRRTHGPAVIDLPWGFAGLYSLSGGLFAKKLKNPVLVACTDGVGTKLMLARQLGKHDTVGIDLVAMSVNDLICVGATPLFFLDYIALGKADKKLITSIAKGVVDGCVAGECALLGGETAEMPGMYADGDYDLAGFAVGIVERGKIVDGKAVKIGDDVIGLASSGIHSNGYSLVRKILEGRDADVTRLGADLLTPTRIYVKAVKEVLRRYKVKKAVKAIANITGGGMIENIPRVLPKNADVEIREGAWRVPPIFEELRRMGEVPREEMYRVFNIGIGMALVVAPYYTSAILKTLKKSGETAWVVGKVVKGSQQARVVQG